MKIAHYLACVPAAVIGVAAVALAAAAAHGGPARWLVIVAGTGLLAVVAWGMRNRRFRFAVNYAAYLALVTFVGLELIFRIAPWLVPVPLRQDLPVGALNRIALHRDQPIVGEGMLYSHAPHYRLRGSITVDADGYRNPDLDPAAELDYVVLGDSMLFGYSAERDLGEYLREAGFSARNLAMGGYAPQQYRDAYERYVVRQRVPHRNVLVFIFIGNDVSDAVVYDDLRNAGGTYLDYVFRPANPPRNNPSWVAHMLISLASSAEERRRVFSSGKSAGPDQPPIAIPLPYRTVQLETLSWWPPPLTAESRPWQLISRTLDEIATQARESGARTTVLLLPSPPTLYSRYLRSLAQADRDYGTTASLLRAYLSSRDVDFVDLREPLRAALDGTFLFADDQDCHFGTEGMAVFSRIVIEALARNTSRTRLAARRP